MTDETKIKLFQNQEVRLKWDDEIEEYYFSVVDVVGILTESKNPRKYWSVLKTRLNKEGVEVATICSQLKMIHAEISKLKIRRVLKKINSCKRRSKHSRQCFKGIGRAKWTKGSEQ